MNSIIENLNAYDIAKISVSKTINMLSKVSLVMQKMLRFSGKEGVVKFILEKDIKILNLCQIPEDGRLKSLSFSTGDERRVSEILDSGERIDGSSLFSFIDSWKSDIYIVPKLDTGFLNPFSKKPTLNLLCDYLDTNGMSLDVAPQNVLMKAEEKLFSSNGIVLKALAELEFYVVAKQETEILFPEESDKNYHESALFAKFEDLRNEILSTMESVGIATKYGHSEVGCMLTKDNTLFEQHEVELLPQRLAEMANTITIAKWVIRNVCAKHGVTVSFSPKIALGHAGTGMHIHLCALRNGKNVLATPDETLSPEAMKMIGGILEFAPSLSALGNSTPVSYLRFIDRKESPMHICWSAGNRLALIRIPLWWNFRKKNEVKSLEATFEYRAPDAFSNAHLLFAGMALAVNYGLRNPEEALKIAEKTLIDVSDKRKRLRVLPLSCSESAKELNKDRKFYEAEGVFPKKIIDKTLEKLRSYKDKNLRQSLANKPEEVEEMLKHYLHYG